MASPVEEGLADAHAAPGALEEPEPEVPILVAAAEGLVEAADGFEALPPDEGGDWVEVGDEEEGGVPLGDAPGARGLIDELLLAVGVRGVGGAVGFEGAVEAGDEGGLDEVVGVEEDEVVGPVFGAGEGGAGVSCGGEAAVFLVDDGDAGAEERASVAGGGG